MRWWRITGAEPELAADAGFAERLLELIDSGRRTATYKLALFMALLDLCARRSDAAGSPPSVLYTREIAERIAAIYWPQVMDYRRGTEVIQLRQITLARSLIRLGLVDEYRLWVLPAAVGQGAALFTGLARPVTLRLIKTTAFPSGILELCYVPASHAA